MNRSVILLLALLSAPLAASTDFDYEFPDNFSAACENGEDNLGGKLKTSLIVWNKEDQSIETNIDDNYLNIETRKGKFVKELYGRKVKAEYQPKISAASTIRYGKDNKIFQKVIQIGYSAYFDKHKLSEHISYRFVLNKNGDYLIVITAIDANNGVYDTYTNPVILRDCAFIGLAIIE